jgi:hypothetical protein
VTISFLIGELMKHVLYKAALGRTKKFWVYANDVVESFEIAG